MSASARPLRPGDPTRVGPYRLLGVLGEGGLGVVYLGESPGGRKVAVKVLRQLDGAARERFAAEAEAARQSTGTGIHTVPVIDFSAEAENPYLVTAFVPAPSLDEWVATHGPLAEAELIALMTGTAEALAAIHESGFLHLDLKPSNVLLAQDGPRLLSSGGSAPRHATLSGRTLGAPTYMAPELLHGAGGTVKSDAFAWAATIVYAATGRGPFGAAGDRDDLSGLFSRILHAEPDLEGVPESVRLLLQGCLEKTPEYRPDTEAMLRWLTFSSATLAHPGRPVPAVPATHADATHAAPPFSSSRPTDSDSLPALATLVFVVLALVGALAVGAALAWAGVLGSLAFGIGLAVAVLVYHLLPWASWWASRSIRRAAAVHARGDPEQAEHMLAKARDLANRRGTARDRVRAEGALASVQRDLGRPAAAEGRLSAAVRQAETLLGPEHPETIALLANRAVVLRDLGRLAEAEAVASSASTAAARSDRVRPAQLLAVRTTLAGIRRDRGASEAAAAQLEPLLLSAREQLGNNDPLTLNIQAALAAAYADLGRAARAGRLLAELVVRRSRRLGDQHPATLRTRVNLGFAQLAEGRIESARQAFRDVLAAAEPVGGEAVRPIVERAQEGLALAGERGS